MDMVMKGVLALVWLAVVPAAAGILFTGKRQLKFAEIFLHGYLLLCNDGNSGSSYDLTENAAACSDCSVWESGSRLCSGRFIVMEKKEQK